MANQTGSGNLNGTGNADTIIGTGSNQTINGFGGNDLLIGDHDAVFIDSGAGNNSNNNALDIDEFFRWSTQPNPDIGDDSVPYTTIMGTGGNEFDYFRVTVGNGETITLDIDYASSQYGGFSFDSEISLLDGTGTQLPNAHNDDASFNFGGLGSNATRDSYLTYQNLTGFSQVYFIRVDQYIDTVIDANATYLLNVSVTGHANSNVYSIGQDTINGGTGDDIIYGMEFNDILNGDDGDDFISGGSGADTINGGEGSDILYIGLEGISAGETYNGGSTGSNRDVLDFTTVTEAYTVNLETSVLNSVDGSAPSTVSDIEIVRAGSGNDVLIGGTAGATPYALYGGAGNDRIEPGSLLILNGDIFDGGAGTDTLDFTSQTDSGFHYRVNLVTNEMERISNGDLATAANFENINAGGGDDNLTGNHIANIITGGEGIDFIDGADGHDTLIGNDGRDTIIGGDGDDDLFGNRGIDFLDPGSGQDDLDGGGDFDRVSYAGSSAGVTVNLDTGIGSGGDAAGDTFIRLERVTGSQFDDIITGNEFGNSLKGNDGADTIFGLGGRDVIEGKAGDDILHGGDKNDNILGGNDNDQLFGDAGFDKLFGGLGNDELTGGADADYFVFNSSNGAFGADVIFDFENGVDRIDVRNVFAISNPANTADTFSDFTVSVSGAYGVKVKFEGGQVIYLDDAATGITVADIDASDFIFA